MGSGQVLWKNRISDTSKGAACHKGQRLDECRNTNHDDRKLERSTRSESHSTHRQDDQVYIYCTFSLHALKSNVLYYNWVEKY
jgi:hypothetical protein